MTEKHSCLKRLWMLLLAIIKWMRVMGCGFDRRDMMANELNNDKWINIDEAAVEVKGLRTPDDHYGV